MTATEYQSFPQFNNSRAQDWAKSYGSQPNEYGYWIEEIDGQIPSELNGTLFRNGAGLLEVGDYEVGHLFDGDGMVCSFSFQNGRVYFQNRFVRTEGYIKEQRAQKILYRGFGTQKPGGWIANFFNSNFKNVSNTSIIYWGDKLWTMWEGGQPYWLNAGNLQTIKKDDLDGLLSPQQPFSAHPKIMDNILINFGVKGGRKQTLTIWELDTEGRKIKECSHPLEGFAILHDMLVTPNYYIFFQHPFSVNGVPFLLGFKTIEECLRFETEGKTKILVISRHNNHRLWELETFSFFGFHHGNAWEEANRIYLETTCGDSFPQKKQLELNSEQSPLENLPYTKLKEFCLDLETEQVTNKEIVGDRGCDMLCFNPNSIGRKYRYLYCNVSRIPHQKGPLQAIMKLDRKLEEEQIWESGNRCFPGEPLFIARSDSNIEDDGWIMSIVYDAEIEKTYLLILDAQDITKEIARLYLKHHIPQSFHGFWSEKCFINLSEQ